MSYMEKRIDRDKIIYMLGDCSKALVRYSKAIDKAQDRELENLNREWFNGTLDDMEKLISLARKNDLGLEIGDIERGFE